MSPRAAARLESIGFTDVFDYRSGKADWVALGLPTEGRAAKTLKAGDVARHDTPTCGLRERMDEVTSRVRERGWDVCVVVNEDNVVLGLHRSRHLEGTRDRAVEDRMIRAPSTFRPNVPVEDLARHMGRRGLDAVPITTSDGKLVGLMRIEDAEDALRERGRQRSADHG